MGEAVQVVFESSDDRDVQLPLTAPLENKPLQKQTSRIESSDILFSAASNRGLRQLARIKHIFFHYTSIDPLGDYVAAELEILDDRIKRESLSAVIGALVSHARGGPLRALSRSLGGPLNSPSFPVTNVSERSTHCIFGDVAGSDVTIGDEELLLERGVLLDSLSDTLVEEGNAGFYILIAVGNAVIARCLITPALIGDGRELLERLKPFAIRAQVLSLGTSGKAHLCAQELGLSGENVCEVESALHLDTLLDSAGQFLLLTSDADCAEYVSRKGLVGFFADQQRLDAHEHIFDFRSFDLREVATLYQRARHLLRKERILAGVATLVGLGLLSTLLYIFAK